MSVIVKRAPKFEILYNPPPGTNIILAIGGRGGQKTYEVSKFCAFSATKLRKRIVVVRDEKALIKESILNEIWERYNTANKSGVLDQYFNKNEYELKEKKTGKVLVYTKGFKPSDNRKQATLKGPSDIDIAVIEEAEDIVDSNKFNTFVDGLRKEGCIVIVMLNTPSVQHFLIKRYFNTKAILDDKGEATGYFEITPKDIPGFVCIQTSYKDNPHLPAHVISNYEGYGIKGHHLYDMHYYMTAILGYASTGRKGQIFTKVKPITLKDYLALPFKEYYGQDFGTASPAALVGVKLNGNTAWMRLINYKPMPVLELGKLYSQLKFNSTDRIVCDYAEPNSINKLSNGWSDLDAEDYVKYPELASGFYAVPCPSKDISAGISLINSMNVFAVEECAELWDEINNYVYAQDKYKNYTDDPIDDFNHALDAARYVIHDQRGLSSQQAY